MLATGGTQLRQPQARNLLKSGANVIKLFWVLVALPVDGKLSQNDHHYGVISTLLVNYGQKLFITLTSGANIIKRFCP
jgi:hypothetical protein